MTKLPAPSAKPKMQDHIFISYSSKDRAFVDQLATELRRLGHTVWIDFEGIRGGDAWKQSIADGLHPSRVVLLVMSPESISSTWVEEEVSTAKRLGKKIIPILLRPLGAITSVVLSEIVRDIHYRDFTKGFQRPFEELLKDLPQPQSGIPGHCQKLIAKLAALPWGLDHYIQEDAKMLPVNASPYEEGANYGKAENLIKRLQISHRLIILGEPGAGKSVALERLAWELASQEPPIVPVLIKLLEYNGENLLEWVRLRLVEHGEIRLRNLEETQNYLDKSAFGFYFLLDGLNEVRPKHRDAIISEITRLALSYPQYPLIVTSRKKDDSWARLRQGSVFQDIFVVQSIGTKQIQRYLYAHLGTEAAVLWKQLDTAMRSLVTTPLLLWLIKEAWRDARLKQSLETVRMPNNRGELYTTFVNKLLRRDAEKSIQIGISESQRLNALETLAYVLHERQSLTIKLRDAEKLVEPEILTALQHNGFLQGDDDLRFAPHQTMQEHFAARAMLHNVMKEANNGPLLRRLKITFNNHGALAHVNDPWWAETFIQMAGLADNANRLVQAIADLNPWLALWCIQEGKKVDTDTRKAIENRSISLLTHGNALQIRQAISALNRLGVAGISRAKDELLSVVFKHEDAESATLALKLLLSLGEEGDEIFRQTLLKTPIQQRIVWGQRIAAFDPRKGVGIRSYSFNGRELLLPDFDWVTIPAGHFNYQGQKALLGYDFRMLRFLVTYSQFQTFLDSGEYENELWWKGMPPDYKALDVVEQYNFYHNHPRDNVNWYQVIYRK